MSLQRNLLANYLGQAFAVVIGLVMLPIHMYYLGAEAFGLVGFLTMLLAWSQLLDLGLTPVLSRELSRYRAGAVSAAQLAPKVRSAEWFFAALGAISVLAAAVFATAIVRHWLRPDHLAAEELRFCVMCMGGVVGARWLTGLYRSGLAGLEWLVGLNVAGTAIVALRSVGVVAVLVFWSPRPGGFFAYQLGVALLELGLMRGLFYRVFPMAAAGAWPNLITLRGLFGAAASMAFLAGLWVVINQADKLVLSWTLALRSYGYFTVAVTLAGGIGLLAAPLNQALQARFTVLAAQGEHTAFERLYRISTQGTCAVMFALAGVMAWFPGPLILAWTSDPVAAQEGARVLPLYALGNAVATVLGLVFLMQFALGQLRWHVLGNGLFALLWLPGVAWAATRAGVVGVGLVWLAGNLAFLVGWVPYVHRRLMPKLGWWWLGRDVAGVVLAEAVVLGLCARLDLAAQNRIIVFGGLGVIAMGAALAGLLAGTETRPVLLRLTRSLLAVKPA